MYVIRKLIIDTEFIVAEGPSSVAVEDVYFGRKEQAAIYHDYDTALHVVNKIWKFWRIPLTIQYR